MTSFPDAGNPSSASLPIGLLVRRCTGPSGTFGELIVGGLRLPTGELPWRANEYAISCIPPGTYRCEFRDSENRGRHYQLAGVPQRAEVLIHTGHWCGSQADGLRTDVRGCILLGQKITELAGQLAMRHSRSALDQVLTLAPQGLLLTVEDATPHGQAGHGWKP